MLASRVSACWLERRVSTQAADSRGGAQARPWAWTPAIPTGDDGQVHILPVRGNVYMLVGAGGNITVHAGDEASSWSIPAWGR